MYDTLHQGGQVSAPHLLHSVQLTGGILQSLCDGCSAEDFMYSYQSTVCMLQSAAVDKTDEMHIELSALSSTVSQTAWCPLQTC